MDPIEASLLALLGALAAGLAAAGLTAVVRVLPGVAGLLLAGRKPWACDVCMSWWTALATVGGLHGITYDPWVWICLPGAIAVAVFLNSRLQAPAPGPMPELQDMDEPEEAEAADPFFDARRAWDDWCHKDIETETAPWKDAE